MPSPGGSKDAKIGRRAGAKSFCRARLFTRTSKAERSQQNEQHYGRNYRNVKSYNKKRGEVGSPLRVYHAIHQQDTGYTLAAVPLFIILRDVIS